MRRDGTCTGWVNGVWLDCCLQHDCDCGENWPSPCLYDDNYALMQCVIASSYSSKAKCPALVQINALLMFVGVTIFNPLLVVIEGLSPAQFGGGEDGYL